MQTLHTIPLGTLLLEADATSLTRCGWVSADCQPVADRSPILAKACRQIDEYFAGTRREFDLPLRIEGTAFQRRVWQAMSQIPYGETVTYSQLAKMCGCPDGQRAAAGACGRNRLALILPCHRVTAAHSLGGYSAHVPNPLEIKRRLLEHERMNQ